MSQTGSTQSCHELSGRCLLFGCEFGLAIVP